MSRVKVLLQNSLSYTFSCCICLRIVETLIVQHLHIMSCVSATNIRSLPFLRHNTTSIGLLEQRTTTVGDQSRNEKEIRAWRRGNCTSSLHTIRTLGQTKMRPIHLPLSPGVPSLDNTKLHNPIIPTPLSRPNS